MGHIIHGSTALKVSPQIVVLLDAFRCRTDPSTYNAVALSMCLIHLSSSRSSFFFSFEIMVVVLDFAVRVQSVFVQSLHCGQCHADFVGAAMVFP